MSKRQQNLTCYFSKQTKKSENQTVLNCSEVCSDAITGTCEENINSENVNSHQEAENTAFASNYESEKYDICNYVNVELTNDVKVEVFRNLSSPPELYVFPAEGKRNLKFQRIWLNKWNWLTYSKHLDGAFCKFCVLFRTGEQVGVGMHQKLGKLVNTKFNNWKNAGERFAEHQATMYHRNNVENAHSIINIYEKKVEPVNLKIDICAKQKIIENRKRLQPIIEAVIFCAQQGLPLRGHRDFGRIDADSSMNEGNFRELLRFRAKCDPVLKDILENSSKNALYTSATMQNEIINSCGELILQSHIVEIKSARFYSILVDEGCDIAGVEQMSLCVRYVDKEINAREIFLKFVPLESFTGRGISDTIIKELRELGLDLKKIRGQGYDGAAAMSGKYNGVQAHVSKMYPKALYVHCAAHSLNLAVSNSCAAPEIRACLGVIGKVYDFFNTPKRQLILQECLQELNLDDQHTLKKMCPTRWVERYNSVSVFVKCFEAITLSLEKISSWDDTDTASQANLLNSAMQKPSFVISLQCIHQLFQHSSVLCKFLQKNFIDLKQASTLADITISKLKELRKNADSEFKTLFNKAEEIALKSNFNLSKPRVASRSQRLNIDVESVEEYFKISLYLPFLDAFIMSIKDRFLSHNGLLAGFQALFPSDWNSVSEEDFQSFKTLVLFYNDDLNGDFSDVKAELDMWYEIVNRLQQSERPKTVLDALKICREDTLPNVYCLLQIMVTLPITTCENERSFSTLRRLKNYLRSTMLEPRLNALALMHIYRNFIPSVDQVLNHLALKKRKIDIKL